MRMLLWDIDGTLLRAGPVAREVFASAVAHAVGEHPGDHGIVMSGKTDPQIAREILATMRIVEAAVDEHLPVILARLEAELALAVAAIRADGHVLPGVPELLARCAESSETVQTVLTGNIAANAALKLAAFELDRWLDLSLGAYGSDHHDRRELVPIAVERARRRGVEPEELWVIGDTPNDLACARAGGARCILVATGRVPYAELAALDAEAVLQDLSDVAAVIRLLEG
jgi:phosphoglycolate phosphatase